MSIMYYRDINKNECQKNVYHAKNFTSTIFYDKRKMHCQEKK